MEPVFKCTSTTLQETSGKSPRFNFQCIDCCGEIIALGTDAGSCHLYDSSTLQPVGETIFLPELAYSSRSEKQRQSVISDCKFCPIRQRAECVLLLLGTASGHVHLYSVRLQSVGCRAVKVQSLQIDDSGIGAVLWCKLEKLMENYNDCLHRGRGSAAATASISAENEAADCESESVSVSARKERECQSAALEALKVMAMGKMGRVYLVHFVAEYVDARHRRDCPVRIVNVQLLFECDDVIVQSSFSMHFVVISCLTKALVLDFSTIYSEAVRAEVAASRSRAGRSGKEWLSRSFVNGANMESMRYFVGIHQIGSRPRSGHFGACFDCQSVDESDQVLSARKSGRLWVAETQSGSVRNTLRFQMSKTPNAFSDGGFSRRLRGDGDSGIVMDSDSLSDSGSVPDSVCCDLGLLVPFRNWTLSYRHPMASGGAVNVDGLFVLDQNGPEIVHWYPSMGQILDVSVVETQCSFYAVYKPMAVAMGRAVDSDHKSGGVVLSKIELCSATESVAALIADGRIDVAIDWVCGHKVSDRKTLQRVNSLLIGGGNGHSKGVEAQSARKFMAHFQDIERRRSQSGGVEVGGGPLAEDQKGGDLDDGGGDGDGHSLRARNVMTADSVMTASAARARRKSSANRQVFNEALEEKEPFLIERVGGGRWRTDRSRQSKKSKRKKKAKPLFVAIDPGPKRLSSVKEQKETLNPDALNSGSGPPAIGGVAASTSTSSSAMAEGVAVRHEVVDIDDDDDGVANWVDVDGHGHGHGHGQSESAGPEQAENERLRTAVLLRATAEIDVILRRRMRAELDVDGDGVDGVGPFGAFRAMRGRLDGPLMERMSLVLGAVENGRVSVDDGACSEWTNAIGEGLQTALSRMLCVFLWIEMESGKQSEDGVLDILKEFAFILDFEWVLRLCTARKLHRALRRLAELQHRQNEAASALEAAENAFCSGNYGVLLRLIDDRGSPLLMLRYLPSLCAAGHSQSCCSLAVAFFPDISPWFVRQWMYRRALQMDSGSVSDDDDGGEQRASALSHKLLSSNLFYLKLLFKVHPRTRCNALLVLDAITLTLSLHRPPSHRLFRASQPDPDGHGHGHGDGHFERGKVPAARSLNAYPEPLTKYVISMLGDPSYFVEWPYLEIVFKEYGFWRGLSRVHLHFDDVHSLSVLSLHLDAVQPIIDVLADAHSLGDADGDDDGGRFTEYRQMLLSLNALSAERRHDRSQNVLTLPLIVQQMTTNLGAKQTALCLSHPQIAPILREHIESGSDRKGDAVDDDHIDTAIYREIVHRQRGEQKRNTLTRSVRRSLTEELRSRFTLHSLNSTQPDSAKSDHSKRGKSKVIEDSAESKEYDVLVETLSGIRHWSDEWAVMRSANAQPPKQRAAASLERNLSDLFVQFV